MKKTIMIAIMALGAVVACKKEESKPVTNPNPVNPVNPVDQVKSVITSGTWNLDSIMIGMIGGPMIKMPQEECEQDNYYKFTSDNKQYIYYGAEKCDSSEVDFDAFDYSINSKADSISFDSKDDKISFYLKSVKTERLELYAVADGYRQVFIFRKR